jgi:hypothetical protein
MVPCFSKCTDHALVGAENAQNTIYNHPIESPPENFVSQFVDFKAIINSFRAMATALLRNGKTRQSRASTKQ